MCRLPTHEPIFDHYKPLLDGLSRQNLFISEKNLLVEGPSDLIHLKIASGFLEAEKRAVPLNEEVMIVPGTGGLDKVVTFIALTRSKRAEARRVS